MLYNATDDPPTKSIHVSVYVQLDGDYPLDEAPIKETIEESMASIIVEAVRQMNFNMAAEDARIAALKMAASEGHASQTASGEYILTDKGGQIVIDFLIKLKDELQQQQQANNEPASFRIDLKQLQIVNANMRTEVLHAASDDSRLYIGGSVYVKLDGDYPLDEKPITETIEKAIRPVIADVIAQMNLRVALQELAEQNSIGDDVLNEKGKQIVTDLFEKRREELERLLATLPDRGEYEQAQLLANLPQKAKEVSALFGLDLQQLNPVKESITVSLGGPLDSNAWSLLFVDAYVEFDGAYTLNGMRMEEQIEKTIRSAVAHVIVQMNLNMTKKDVTIAALHTAASQGLSKRKSIGNYVLTEKGNQVMTDLLNKRRNDLERLLETLPGVEKYEQAQSEGKDTQKGKYEPNLFGFDLQQLNPVEKSIIPFLFGPTDNDPRSTLDISVVVKFDGAYTLDAMQMEDQIKKTISQVIAGVIVQMNINMAKEDETIADEQGTEDNATGATSSQSDSGGWPYGWVFGDWQPKGPFDDERVTVEETLRQLRELYERLAGQT